MRTLCDTYYEEDILTCISGHISHYVGISGDERSLQKALVSILSKGDIHRLQAIQHTYVISAGVIVIFFIYVKPVLYNENKVTWKVWCTELGS